MAAKFQSAKLGAAALAFGMTLMGISALSTEAAARVMINADFFGTASLVRAIAISRTATVI